MGTTNIEKNASRRGLGNNPTLPHLMLLWHVVSIITPRLAQAHISLHGTNCLFPFYKTINKNFLSIGFSHCWGRRG